MKSRANHPATLPGLTEIIWVWLTFALFLLVLCATAALPGVVD